jgi:hypothetical protein
VFYREHSTPNGLSATVMKEWSGLNIAGLVVTQDVATAACGLLNAGYFARYWWQSNGLRGRRVGAAALALVGGAAVVEAFFSQWLFWVQQGTGPLDHLPPGGWAMVRLPLLAATAFISFLVLRRLSS